MKVKTKTESKNKKLTFQDLEIEKNKLYVSKENPERLKQIVKELDFFYYGIK